MPLVRNAVIILFRLPSLYNTQKERQPPSNNHHGWPGTYGRVARIGKVDYKCFS